MKMPVAESGGLFYLRHAMSTWSMKQIKKTVNERSK
jgi:hypothetical protein